MSPALATDIIRHALSVTLVVVAPLLATALLVGVVVSLFQAVTQLQEQTLTFVPKLLAVSAVLVVLLPWILAQLTGYLAGVLGSLPTLVR